MSNKIKCTDGWWIVYPGAEKLDIGPREPVACFRVERHAHDFGKRLWPGFYDVEQNIETESAELQLSETQDVIDWSAFAKKFKQREGFDPNPRDSRAKELFMWFSIGAHEEYIGRLNAANASTQGMACEEPKREN